MGLPRSYNKWSETTDAGWAQYSWSQNRIRVHWPEWSWPARNPNLVLAPPSEWREWFHPLTSLARNMQSLLAGDPRARLLVRSSYKMPASPGKLRRVLWRGSSVSSVGQPPIKSGSKVRCFSPSLHLQGTCSLFWQVAHEKGDPSEEAVRH